MSQYIMVIIGFLYIRFHVVRLDTGIGDRESLAVKLALEEWRHWLEGANHPFTELRISSNC